MRSSSTWRRSTGALGSATEPRRPSHTSNSATEAPRWSRRAAEMDFRLYASVIWRFRIIVVLGLILAIALATLSVVRVSSQGFTYRDSRLWSATMKLKVTQDGCPECRLYAQRQSGTGDGATKLVSPKEPVVDPARLATLAIYYSQIITSDPVRRLADRGDGVVGKIIATPDRDA